MDLYDSPSLRARFWSKVDTSGDCWLWTASLNASSYGQIMLAAHRRPSRAHRVAWELTNGPIPDGLWVLHRCDVRACVNPAHLFLGTHRDNMADRDMKGRQASGVRSGAYTHPERIPRGEQNVQSKLTVCEVHKIRALYAAGGISQRALATMFGVAQSTIAPLLRGKTWKDV